MTANERLEKQLEWHASELQAVNVGHPLPPPSGGSGMNDVRAAARPSENR
jgi:hypothetical protein